MLTFDVPSTIFFVNLLNKIVYVSRFKVYKITLPNGWINVFKIVTQIFIFIVSLSVAYEVNAMVNPMLKENKLRVRIAIWICISEIVKMRYQAKFYDNRCRTIWFDY